MAQLDRSVEETRALCQPLYDEPVNTIQHVRDDEYLIRGRTATYEMHATAQTCTCPYYEHQGHRTHLCRHLEELERQWETITRACPFCRGWSVIAGTEGLCPACEGKGRMELPLYEEAVRARRIQQDAELRKIFA